MNAPLAASLFAAVDLAPRDPILGVTEAFNADPNPRKVNLGVGVYYDDNGKMPLLDCVKRAEREMTDKASPRGVPADRRHSPRTTRPCRRCCSARTARSSRSGRAVTVQALGGTGGLQASARISCASSRPARKSGSATRAGRTTARCSRAPASTSRRIRTTTPATHGLDFAAMRAALEAMPAGHDRRAARVLPQPDGRRSDAGAMGRDPRDRARTRAVPFLDIAYQGFGDGIDADGSGRAPVRRDAGPLFVSSSFSKSFSLYGERVGALTVVTADKDEAARVLSQLKRVVRANYSNPPTHGGQIVAHGARPARAARGLGDRSSAACASASARCARRWCEACRARAGRRFRLRARAARHVLLLGPRPRRRCSGCARSSRSTPSTPGASASRRSTRTTSSTSPMRSPRSSRRRGGSCSALRRADFDTSAIAI